LDNQGIAGYAPHNAVKISWPDVPEAFIAAYLDAWNEPDTERICDAYFETAPIFQAGAVQAFDRASRLTYLGGWVDMTRDELALGTRWECPSMSVEPLGTDAALVTVRWVFRRSDGTELQDYDDSYVLGRIGGRWGFIAEVIHTA
jgi:ketosteroid isomerase-like protein